MKFPEPYRITRRMDQEWGTSPGDPFGWFMFRPCSRFPAGLKCMVCDGTQTQWEHVSVSHYSDLEPPSWAEMVAVKDLFWGAEECAVQFHPPQSEYVNTHPGVLHLWRHVRGFPRPPKALV